MLDGLTNAISYLADPVYWVAFAVAIGLSAVVSLVPGVSSVIVMALALPFVVFNIQDPAIGLVLLAVITGVNNTLDSVPAILIGLPGGSTQVTYLEGHQLARKGLAAHTLGAVYTASAIGGLIGAICLLVSIPVIRPFILSFGYPEIAAVALVGLAFIATLSQGAWVKGMMGAMLGLLVGTIGIAPATGTHRFVFGQLFLWDGMPIVPVILGIFAIPEMVDLMMSRRPVASSGASVSLKEVLSGMVEGARHWKMTIRQSIFGVAMGAVPGVGAPVIEWLSYAFGILFTRDKSQFGKGSLEGLLFTESAQNSKEGGQAIPTLALGIPGGQSWAIVIAAMIIYGIAPGPQMLNQSAHITMVLVITLALGNLAMTMIGVLAAPYLARLTLIPYPAVGAIVIPMSLVAAFLSEATWLALPIALSFGVLGMIMKRFRWPRPPFIIGFILGPIIEDNLMNALSVHGLGGILTRPFTIVLVALAVALAVAFQWFVSRSLSSPTVPSGAEEAGTAPAAPGIGLAARMRQFHLSWELVVPLLFIAIALYFVQGALDFSPRAAAFPLWTGIGIAVLGVFQVVWQATAPREAAPVRIMDLGMLSQGMEGASRAGLMIAGLFLVFGVLSVTVGLRFGAMAFALLGPLALMEGRWRVPTAIIAAGTLALFCFVVADVLMNVIWPTPVVGRWLGLI